ncbi:MAG: hypothetical protein WAT79_08415 [Saprospiraceae bacterium]
MKEFKIKKVSHVKKFFRYLVKEYELCFHPDDDFRDYVYTGGRLRVFSDQEVDYCNGLMDKCYKVCERNGKDIYKVGMKVLSKRLKLG